MKQAPAANRRRLWVFGQSWAFYLVETDHILNADNFNPSRHQKTQIVLHGTAGNGTAEQVIDWWNNPASSAASAHYVVERIAVGQAARPGGAGGADQLDNHIVDVVRVLDDEVRSFHGGLLNNSSIGIEISNAAWSWFGVTTASEPTVAGRHVPLASCPAPLNIGSAAAPNLVCNHARPADVNRFIHLPVAIEGQQDYQSVQDEQYMALTLLLRHLCIRHRIARKFLGASREEIFRHWLDGGTPVERRVNRSRVMHFRGILAHRNCHPDKVCPGIVNRNRLFRGITDEWWLPVEPEGQIRPYYSGPFRTPPHVAGQPRSSHFRFTAAGRIEGVPYRDADLDALLDTKSRYDLDQIEAYYRLTETMLGGMFPVGLNRVWHGGVHLSVPDANPCVYAAASGTIVAARLASNRETDAHPKFGSQRFVLLRHAVYRTLQRDPQGLGDRIDYDADPVLVFTLYMHLLPVRDPAAEHDENPPWFNQWRAANPGVDVGMDGDKGRVFAPDIMVSVGDILGTCGHFRGRRMLHFEVLSHRNRELTGAPWNDPQRRVVDDDQNVICDVGTLDRFIRDRSGDGIDLADILRAAPDMRPVKAFHKSEWALTQESQIESLVPHPDRRRVLWPHFRRFSWVGEAVAALPRLGNELGDASGMFWHYHPITVMHHINELVAGENWESRESENHDVNVEIGESGFLTRFVDWRNAPAPAHFAAAAADGERLVVSEVSMAADAYTFTRREVACGQPGNHAPGATPPTETRFSYALLEAMERIRRHFNAAIDVTLSHVCQGHGGAPALCVINEAASLEEHQAGIAADIRPTNHNPASCRQLWNSVAAILDTLGPQYAHMCGSPSQVDYPAGYHGIEQSTRPAAVEAKLRANPQQNLTAAEAQDFRIHLRLVADAALAARQVDDLPVRLRVTFQSVTARDDQDTFGSGEWTLDVKVNGAPLGLFVDVDVDTGDVIPLRGPAWTREVEIPAGGALKIRVSGKDEDVFSDDNLGTVSLDFSRGSRPAWGIGRTSAVSSNGSYVIDFFVESLNAQEF